MKNKIDLGLHHYGVFSYKIQFFFSIVGFFFIYLFFIIIILFSLICVNIQEVYYHECIYHFKLEYKQ